MSLSRVIQRETMLHDPGCGSFPGAVVMEIHQQLSQLQLSDATKRERDSTLPFKDLIRQARRSHGATLRSASRHGTDPSPTPAPLRERSQEGGDRRPVFTQTSLQCAEEQRVLPSSNQPDRPPLVSLRSRSRRTPSPSPCPLGSCSGPSGSRRCLSSRGWRST